MQQSLEENNSLPKNYSFHQVTRIDKTSLTPEKFFQKHQKNGTPVVVTGLLDSIPVWDLDFLCEKLGDRKYPVRFNGWERYKKEKNQWDNIGSGVESRSMPFREYAQMVRSEEAYNKDIYLGRCALKNTPLEDTPILRQAEVAMGLKMPATSPNLWVCPDTHVTPLHYDPMDGTLVQLYGSKRLVLFPPSQTYNLYPLSLFNYLRYGLKLRANYSQVYPERPNLVKFPRFEQALAHRYEVVLNPGEILFIPCGWWHEVTSLGDSVVCSINRFWHIFPLFRAMTTWNKWRLHSGALMAAPHIAGAWLAAIASKDREQKLRHLIQRL